MRGELRPSTLAEMLMWLAVVLATSLLFPGCPHPAPPGTKPTVVQCGAGAVESCAPQALPLVNECLAATSDVVPCILGITRVLGCAVYDVLACIVKDQGDRAAAAYAANPADTRDHWRAQRARDFLSRTQAQFAP